MENRSLGVVAVSSGSPGCSTEGTPASPSVTNDHLMPAVAGGSGIRNGRGSRARHIQAYRVSSNHIMRGSEQPINQPNRRRNSRQTPELGRRWLAAVLTCR